MFGKLELLDHLRAQQAHNVGTHGVTEARMQLFGHSRTAEHVTTLEHQRLAASLGEIGGAGQAVVATADDDGIVLSCRHQSVSLFRGGSKNGVFTTTAGTL